MTNAVADSHPRAYSNPSPSLSELLITRRLSRSIGPLHPAKWAAILHLPRTLCQTATFNRAPGRPSTAFATAAGSSSNITAAPFCPVSCPAQFHSRTAGWWLHALDDLTLLPPTRTLPPTVDPDDHPRPSPPAQPTNAGTCHQGHSSGGNASHKTSAPADRTQIDPSQR